MPGRCGVEMPGRIPAPAKPPPRPREPDMAKRDLSAGQSKIVKRYYDNLDTIVATRLQELVTDLYLADTDAKQARLWKGAQQQLAKTPADPGRVAAIIEARDAEALAVLVNKLVAGDQGVLRSDKR